MITLGDLDLLSDSSDGDDEERWKYVSSEEDYFSEMGDTDEGGESLPPGDVTSDDGPAELPSDSVSLVHDGQISAPVVELYDSGSTHHISPYKDKFTSLTDIPPKSFSAANKQSFNATAVGDLVIDVPNGYDTTKLTLTEVLARA